MMVRVQQFRRPNDARTTPTYNGMSDVTTAPVTLEELFVALMRTNVIQ